MKVKIRCCILLFLILYIPLNALAAAGSDTIKVVARANVKPDRIQLRWAVTSSSSWYFTNKNGFTVVRHTIVRDGTVLDDPEKKILTATPLKPKPLNDWQNIAQSDNYAAVIAQALYGESFEVSGGQSSISQIIALSQEQQQRYAMSLMAAELSFPAALHAGWGFEDRTVKKGERYLYQVIPANTTPKHTVENGAVYVSLNDYSELSRPLDFSAVWGNGSVLLTWNYKALLPYYNAYHVERSEDNRNFVRRTKMPLTNIMDNDRMFHTDSITNGRTYYYRLLGVTAFGDESAPSDTVSGKGADKLVYVPFIKRVLPDDKGGVSISWEFDERGNSEITGFELRQSTGINGPYTVVTKNILPALRITYHKNPLPESYLTIAAIPKEGEPTVSFPHLLQMEDTIPPAVPQNLKGYVDTLGVVHLRWDINTEPDFYGYRIYRGQTKGEELIPLNDKAHPANEFSDTIEIRNLNTKVYYAVSSLDRRYNQSGLCEVIELEKPVMIKPSPPYITQYEAGDDGIRLEWARGRDETIRSYRIYRKEKGDDKMTRLEEISDSAAVSYLDPAVVNGTSYIYHVRSVTGNGLESDASPEVSVKARTGETGAADIKQFKSVWREGGIALTWEHTVPDVRSISIYRKEGEEALSLWRELEIWRREIADTNAKRNTAYEYMLVIKNKAGKVFSKNVNTK
jgi:fibronectin type 3 domain-containing protein